MIGFLAYSLAGHDKGEVYLIVEETKDFVYVVNGTVRTVDKPKKKNKRHIQIIKNHNPGLEIPSVTLHSPHLKIFQLSFASNLILNLLQKFQ